MGVKPVTNATFICSHQEQMLNFELRDAEEVGKEIQLYSEQASRLGITTIMPFDLTYDASVEWKRRYIRWMFQTTGSECPTCGHIATGEFVKARASTLVQDN